MNLSYVHHTHLDAWYARLGYYPIVRWNSRSILWQAGTLLPDTPEKRCLNPSELTDD